MKNRVFYFDLLRVFAAMCVIIIHVSGYSLYTPIASADFIFANIFVSATYLAVPIFIMISGAFMLDENKQISTKVFFQKYVLNLLVILLIWVSLYTIKSFGLAILRSESYSLKNFLKDMLLAEEGHHLWYLFMAIGLYLITPVLKLFVRKENKNKILYLIIILSVFSFISSALANYNNDYVLIFANFFNKSFLNSGHFLVYYLLGWYLSNFHPTKKNRILIYFLGIAGLLYSILSTQLLSIYRGTLANMCESTTLNTMLYSVAVFVLFQQLFKDAKESRFTKFISKISKLTFGVYLIHMAIFPIFTRIVPSGWFPLIRIPVTCLLTIVTCFIISFIISKIPVIKKIIRG